MIEKRLPFPRLNWLSRWNHTSAVTQPHCYFHQPFHLQDMMLVKTGAVYYTIFFLATLSKQGLTKTSFNNCLISATLSSHFLHSPSLPSTIMWRTADYFSMWCLVRISMDSSSASRNYSSPSLPLLLTLTHVPVQWEGSTAVCVAAHTRESDSGWNLTQVKKPLL